MRMYEKAPSRLMRKARVDDLVRHQIEHAPELIVVHRRGHGIFANRCARDALDTRALDELCHQRGRVRVLGTDGAPKIIDVSSIALVFGGDLAIATIARDVTAASDDEARLLRGDRMNALGTFAAGVASEISDPLTAVVVNVDHVARRLRALLATSSDGPELAKLIDALSHAMASTERVQKLARDLVALANGPVERRHVVDVRGVLESAVQAILHAIRGRARLVRHFRDVPPVEGNEHRLGQLFLSLLINAAQSIPEGNAASQEVRVSTQTDAQGRAVVEIADTGLGIAPDVLPKVFDPFFTTRPAHGGGGLGLSIAYGTVRSMDGEMSVDSVVGSGSVVRVSLPATRGWTSSHSAARCIVLVVDSDPEVAAALAHALAEEHEPVVASSARDALGHIRGGAAIDAVVCDVSLLEMTGVDFYAEVLRHAPSLASHVIFLSCGALSPRARAFAESLGPRCLEKPPDMSKLRDMIRRVAREPR